MACEGQEQLEYWCDRRLIARLTAPDGQVTTRELPRPFAVLGSKADCELVIDDAALDPRTLFVCITRAGIAAIALSPRAKKAGQTLLIPHGREIPLAGWQVAFDVEGPEPVEVASEDPSTMHCLTWKTAVGRQYLQLRNEIPVVVGRRAPAGLVLSDERLSGLHCCVVRSGDQCWAIDLASTNGTWARSERHPIHALKVDESFVVGQHRFHFTQLLPPPVRDELEQAKHSAERELEDTLGLHRDAIDDITHHQAGLITALKATQDQLDLQREQYELAMNKQQTLLEAQKSRIVELEEDCERAEAELAAKAELDTSLGYAKQALQSEVSSLQADVERLRQERCELDLQLANRESELATREQELEQLKEEVENQRLETELLKEELVTERRILKDLELHLQGDQVMELANPAQEEHCVASPDFHAILDEALGSLPRLDD